MNLTAQEAAGIGPAHAQYALAERRRLYQVYGRCPPPVGAARSAVFQLIVRANGDWERCHGAGPKHPKKWNAAEVALWDALPIERRLFLKEAYEAMR